jgi:hypothetical protein
MTAQETNRELTQYIPKGKSKGVFDYQPTKLREQTKEGRKGKKRGWK